jgi:predicted Zn finger-like uncharacterized protein
MSGRVPSDDAALVLDTDAGLAEALGRYLDEDLSAAQRERVETMLADSKSARRLLDRLRGAQEALREWYDSASVDTMTAVFATEPGAVEQGGRALHIDEEMAQAMGSKASAATPAPDSAAALADRERGSAVAAPGPLQPRRGTMRIVCESCGTNYQISDDKVGEKRVRVRCKKCGFIITVEPIASDSTDEEPGAEVSTGDILTADEWLYVVDGEEMGPCTDDEIESLVKDGTIGLETYLWRDGMEEWLHFEEIEEFAELRSRYEAVLAERAAALEAELAEEPTDPFAELEADDEVTDDGRGGNGYDRDAEGQLGVRNPDSVLFSLDTLGTVKEAPKSAETLPTTEESGLIDVRALADSQSALVEEVPAKPAAPEPTTERGLDTSLPAAAVPIGVRRSHRGLQLMLGAGAVIILGLVLAIVLVVTSGDDTADQELAATDEPPAPSGEGTPEESATGPEEGGAPVQVVPTSELLAANSAGTLAGADVNERAQAVAQLLSGQPGEGDVVAARERDEDEERSERRRRRERQSSERDDEEDEESEPSSDEEETPRVAVAEEPDEDEAGGDDPLDSIVGDLRSSRVRDDLESDDSSAGTQLPDELSRSQINRVMRRHRSDLAACRRYASAPPGEVVSIDISITINNRGRVTDADANSSTGAERCVENVVLDMSFPEIGASRHTFAHTIRMR